MNRQPIRVLFLCTGNSARSIMAEAILNTLGSGKFEARSAGSHPTGVINAAAIDKLRECGHATCDLRCKSWDEFESPDTPAFDYVITVCDNAANEPCPVWSGSPLTEHWGIPDPAAVEGCDESIRQAFDAAYDRLAKRIAALVSLSPEKPGQVDDRF